MGVKQLSKLIKEHARKAVVSRAFSYFSSDKIAIDASMSIYQFLVAVRSDGQALGYGDTTTSHLSGIFYRTIRLLEHGIVPVYVFDGPAPAGKVDELKKRSERREKAGKLLEAAVEAGDQALIEKFEKRQVKVEKQHVDECKLLLKLMGVPYATAPSEAEAYCAFLCKRGCVRGVATEDMDALCFGSHLLLRGLNAAQSKKLDIEEYNLGNVLEGLGLTMDEFIDLCILLGCDFCDTIKGVGLKRAYDFIKKHGSIEAILEKENVEPKGEFNYAAARQIFKELSEIGESAEFSMDYANVDREGIVKFMCAEKGFDETRITNGIEKMMKTKQRGGQKKLTSFFTKM